MQISALGTAMPSGTHIAPTVLSAKKTRPSKGPFSPYSVVRAQVSILGVDITGIVDSGASNTVMSYHTAQKLQLGKHIKEVDMPFWNADGAQSVPVGLGQASARAGWTGYHPAGHLRHQGQQLRDPVRQRTSHPSENPSSETSADMHLRSQASTETSVCPGPARMPANMR